MVTVRELKKLEVSGVDRSKAVHLLLSRIAGDYKEPSKRDVSRIMGKFRLSHEDAKRALIVEKELRRLKRGGLDSLTAIEELTHKMESSCVASSPRASARTKLGSSNSRRKISDESVSRKRSLRSSQVATDSRDLRIAKKAKVGRNDENEERSAAVAKRKNISSPKTRSSSKKQRHKR